MVGFFFFLLPESKGVKCVGGNTCCNSNNKCGIGEGDCDSDSDCLDVSERERESLGMMRPSKLKIEIAHTGTGLRERPEQLRQDQDSHVRALEGEDADIITLVFFSSENCSCNSLFSLFHVLIKSSRRPRSLSSTSVLTTAASFRGTSSATSRGQNRQATFCIVLRSLNYGKNKSYC